MIRINHESYALAQARLARGAWRIDPNRGLLKADADELAGHTNKCGYLAVSFSREGRRTVTVFTHRVVWEALRGPIPDGMYVNHRDGDKTNNAIDNLELVTHSENMKHARRTGLLNQWGEANPSAKLTESNVREIRARLAAGETGLSLAAQYGVTSSVISSIKNRRSWARVA